METPDFEKIAAQLRCPSGEDGILTGEKMNESNEEMILRAIELIHPENDHRILEIGPGNARHALDVLAISDSLTYHAVDISETMIELANKQYVPEIAAGRMAFSLTDGIQLPFADDYFDSIFTANTLYFWENPSLQLQEIKRVLKPDGICCIAFRTRRFMEKLPFVQHGFRLYSEEEAQQLLTDNGFTIHSSAVEAEETMSIMETVLQKERVLIVAGK